MRIAFVSIPHFLCAVEIARDPNLANKPLLVAEEGQAKRVLARSPQAAERGVSHQMTLRKALRLCPDALVTTFDPVHHGRVWEKALGAFSEIAPEVEDLAYGQAYLNVSGLQAHYAGEQDLGMSLVAAVREATGLDAAVGIASGKQPAFAAASTVPPLSVCIVDPGMELTFLAPLPVGLLTQDPEVMYRLNLLGLNEIGDLARLTVPELQSQFGFEGERLWQLANGIDKEPVFPLLRLEALTSTFTFEAPVAGIDVMTAVAKQLFSRLLPSLAGRATRTVTLQGELVSGLGWEHRFVLRGPISEEHRLVRILHDCLENFPPSQALRSMSLKLEGLTGETGQQLSLDERSRLRRQLEDAISQLKVRYGHSPVYRCLEVEAWSPVPEDRWILVESDI